MYEGINKGICVATGELIGLIHSDDFFYSTNTITQIVKKIEDDKADVVYGNGLFVDFNNTDKVIRKWVSGTYERKRNHKCNVLSNQIAGGIRPLENDSVRRHLSGAGGRRDRPDDTGGASVEAGGRKRTAD